MFLCGSTSMVRWNMSENIAALLASLLLMIAPIGPNQDGFNATDFDACAYIDSVDAMICELESALGQGDAQLALRLSDVEMLDLMWNELRCAHMYACDGDVTFIKNLDGSLDVLIDIRYTVGYELMRALGAGPAYSYSAPDAPLELKRGRGRSGTDAAAARYARARAWRCWTNWNWTAWTRMSANWRYTTGWSKASHTTMRPMTAKTRTAH